MTARKRKPTPRPKAKPKAKAAGKKPRPSTATAPPKKPPRKPPAPPAGASPAAPTPGDRYDRHRSGARDRSARMSRAGRDIGPIPKPLNPERRARGLASLRAFALEYFPERFPLEFSRDHDQSIETIDVATTDGGLYAFAMPRGSGKTTLCEVAVIRAAVYGLALFVALIGATGDASKEMLEAIKNELETNERLAEDFPEVCFPIAQLEGQTQRCHGQHTLGHPTKIQWKKSSIVLPCIAGSAASEVCIKVSGITGRVRGMKHPRTDGRIVRPTLIIVDDPQTDDSARSPNQVRKRLRVMNGAILKLPGPEDRIAAVCPCTVIEKGDMADQLLDREKNPHWQGKRAKALYAFPTKMDLWQKYAVLRSEEQRADGDGSKARRFYAENRAEMDAGAEVGWPQRKDPEDLSALETLMQQFFEDKHSFFAELQNEPIDDERSADELAPADVVGRFSGRARGLVPQFGSKLTCFIDVQKTLLYWMVCAWRPEDFTGAVIDYGTFPDQRGRGYYTLADAQYTLENLELQEGEQLGGVEAQIRRGLKALVDGLHGREWQREDGMNLRLDRILVDAGYNADVVYEYCRSAGGKATPSHGRAIGAGSTPMHETKVKVGEELGFHWVVKAAASKRAIRHVLTDTYFWKSFLVSRFRTPDGDPGAITLFGTSRKDGDHEMLAHHLTAEKPVPKEEKGRKVVAWELKPGGPDNHFLDCITGCYVAASMVGATLPGTQSQAPPKKKRLSFAEQARIQREKAGR